MSFEVVIVIVVTAFIQSIFGVGVLLFGTPLLLLLGYGFIDAIIILLPISISINLIQIVKDYRSVDFDFYKKILIFTIPFVIVFLFLVTQVQINIGFIVGIFLLVVAVKDYSHTVKRFIDFTMSYEKTYFSIMGIVHGLTNLGGSLLTAIVHSKDYTKHITRVTVAISYATFAVFQILTLLISRLNVEIQLVGTGIYVLIAVTIFTLTEKFVFMEIDNEKYSKYFAVFLFATGVLLILKSL
jgi:uncharacterized membrane protein YfcA